MAAHSIYYILGLLIIVTVSAYLIFYSPAQGQLSSTTTTTPATTSILAVVTYPKNSQMEITSIQPNNLSVGANLNFNMTFKNIGNNSIYYTPYCGGSPLTAFITPSILISDSGPAVCAQFCSMPALVSPGMNAEVKGVNCGGMGKITNSGNATVYFTFRYGLNTSYPGSDTISFSLPVTFH